MQNNINSVLGITKKEKDAVIKYRLENHEYVNAILERSIDREIYLEENNIFYPLDADKLESLIRQILNMYSLMYKNIKKNYIKPNEMFFRVELDSVLDEMKNTTRINKFLGTVLTEEKVDFYLDEKKQEKNIVMKITKTEEVPFIFLKDVMDEKYAEEAIISPFTQIVSLEEISRFKNTKEYNLKLDKQKVVMVSELEVHELQKHIFNNVEKIFTDFKKYLLLGKDLTKQQMQRDSLTFRLLDRTLSKEEKEKIDADIQKISANLTEDIDTLNAYKDNYIEWKDNTIYYVKYMCEKIKQAIDKEYQIELENAKSVVKEEELQGFRDMLILSRQSTLDKIIKNKKGIMQIISNLERIEVKQEKFKDLSVKIRVNYMPYCNVEKDKEQVNLLIEKLDALKKEVQNTEVNVVDGLTFDKENERINRILQINVDIEKWITEVLEKEMQNINKGELLYFKRAISHRIDEMKAMSNIKLIHAENERIENKSNLRKILDKITGQARKDEIILQQNEIKENAIKQKLQDIKYEAKEEYSTHEMVADLDIYIADNSDKEILAQDIHRLKKLRNNIGEIFKLQEESIEKIIQNRLKNNLPVEVKNKKMSREEKAKLETEKYLVDNGYVPNEDSVIDEILGQSQALLANETKRLLTYIKEKNEKM